MGITGKPQIRLRRALKPRKTLPNRRYTTMKKMDSKLESVLQKVRGLLCPLR